jgi:SnoaL-like domain
VLLLLVHWGRLLGCSADARSALKATARVVGGILGRLVPDGPTTPDLADVFRRLDEAMNRNDIDEVMSFFAADAIWDVPEGLGTYKGAAAIRSFFGEWARTYAQVSFETGEIRDLGSGVSLCVVSFSEPARVAPEVR